MEVEGPAKNVEGLGTLTTWCGRKVEGVWVVPDYKYIYQSSGVFVIL